MQVKKPDLHNAILAAAKQEFARQGYHKSSMRHIAARASIRVGNIYNYFGSKDELFRAVVTPAIEALDALFLGTGADGTMEMAESLTKILHKNRVAIRILLFGSQGSSLENIREHYAARVTEAAKKGIDETASTSHLNGLALRLQCAWHFTLIEEMLRHDVKASEVKRILDGCAPPPTITTA